MLWPQPRVAAHSRSARLRLINAALSGAVAIVLAGCGVSGQPDGSVLTGAGDSTTRSVPTTQTTLSSDVAAADLRGSVSLENVGAVTQKVWQQREKARTHDDAAALRRIDTGVEQERDLGVTINAEGGGDWSQRLQRPLGSAIYVVPPENRYPKSYLSVVQTSAPYVGQCGHATEYCSWVALLVLTKSTPAARWRVALESGGTGSMFDLPHSQRAYKGSSQPHPGYSATSRQPSWIQPRTALTDLARLYQHYADFGTPPSHSIFQPGTWTTGMGRRLNTSHGRTTLSGQITSVGTRQYLRYFVDRTDPVFHFDFGGADLICGAVRGVNYTIPGQRNGYLAQNATRSNWGGWLAPGAYASITQSLLHQVCMIIPPTRAQRISVISGDDLFSYWNATGRRLQPSRSDSGNE
jgi:hypothetical protein